jgi:hypothetical protein
VTDHVSHPHKTSGKIMVLCISFFIFLGNKLKDKRFCKEWQKALLEYNCNMVKFLPNIWTLLFFGRNSYYSSYFDSVLHFDFEIRHVFSFIIICF